MIVRRSISVGTSITLSFTPGALDFALPAEINVLFPEVFMVGSSPLSPTREVCKVSRDDAEPCNAEVSL